HVERKAPQVDEDVRNDLTRAVIRDLTAAVDLHDRDVAGRKEMRSVGIEAEREYRRVLDEPDLVRRLRGAPLGEVAHLLPDRVERPTAEIADEDAGWGGGVLGRDRRGAHSTISISAFEVSSR